MGGEAEEKPNSRSAFWSWLFWLAAGVMLYVFSTGPAMLLDEKKLLPRPAQQGLEVFYTPLWWVCEKNPSCCKGLGLYWHLWAPKTFDKDGKIVIKIF